MSRPHVVITSHSQTRTRRTAPPPRGRVTPMKIMMVLTIVSTLIAVYDLFLLAFSL